MDLNPFDNNDSFGVGDAAAAAALAILSRGALRMPVKGVLRPIDFIKNRDLVSELKTAEFLPANVLNRATATKDLTRKVYSDDVAERLKFPQDPTLRTKEMAPDKRPFDLYENIKTGNLEKWGTVPRDEYQALIYPEGAPVTSQVAADISRFNAGLPVKTMNKRGEPYRYIERDYTSEGVGPLYEELATVMGSNMLTPQLAALQFLRGTYGAGPLAQIRFVRDIRGLATPRKQLRKEAKKLAREFDTTVEDAANAIAITTPKTDFGGTMSRIGKVRQNMLTGELLPESILTNEARKVKTLKEDALLNRALKRLSGMDRSMLPTKTREVGRGLAGEQTVAFDDADLLRALGMEVNEATIKQLRNNPVLIQRLREQMLEELTSGRIGDILGSTALTKDPFILQAILRGRL